MENYYINNDNNRVENPCLTPSEGKKRVRRGEEEGKKRGRWHLLSVAAILGMMIMMPFVGWGQVTITTDANSNGVIEDSEKNLYLIQTNQFESFYMVDTTMSNVSRISTNNIPSPRMLWYFLDAGTDGSTQYYYIICNTNNKYICHGGGTANNDNSRGVSLVEKNASNEERCKFKLVEDNSNGTVGFYNIDVKGDPTYYGLNKRSGSVNISYPVRLTNTDYIHDYSSKWKFIPYNGTFTWPDPPFTPSTTGQYHCFKIHNISNGSYYVSSDDATPKNVTISNTASDNMAWYFKEVDDADPWIQYYYIVNPAAGEYMYYKGTATNGSDQDNAIILKEKTTENEDRFQFIIVRTARMSGDNRVDAFTIIPKLLKDKYWNSNSISPTSITNGNPLGIRNGRGADNNNSHWKFETYNVEVEAPEITFNNATNEVTITSNVEGAFIYYTTNGDTPTSALTPHTSPVTFYQTTPCSINAIAAKYGVFSSIVTTYNLQKVATPTFSFNTATNEVSISSTAGASIYYSIGTTDPVIGENQYTAPFVLQYEQSNQPIKAIAVKEGGINEGWINSDMGQETIKLNCYMPTFSFDNGTQQVTLSCEDAQATMYYTTNGNSPVPGQSGTTEYTGDPIGVTSGGTVKAIAVHTPNYNTSNVAELTIAQVATPTIQDNGSNAVSITCATDGATIYYAINSTPVVGSSPIYSEPLREGVSSQTINAIAVKNNMINSAMGYGTVTLQCEGVTIHRSGEGFVITCAFPSTGATIYYETASGSGTPATPNPSTSQQATSGEHIDWPYGDFPVTITAIATAASYYNSAPVTTYLSQDIQGSGTQNDPYLITSQDDVSLFVDKANDPDEAGKYYKVTSTNPLNFGSADVITQPFSGNFDGNLQTLTGLTHALFDTIDGGTVKNVMLDAVGISGGTNAGAIANVVTGTSDKKAAIYNCGVLSGSVSGSGYVGGIVGQLGASDDNDKCYARVINCFSYATVSGGSDVGGIVGYNCFATTASNIRTMVMNCMFYGDITGGTNNSPVFGGFNIANLQGGLNTFNYYAYEQLPTSHISSGKYNSTLAVEEKYLNRFEFYRLLLNSNKKLAAFYATGSVDDADQKMAKWVLETADRTISNPYPYPILKAQGKYPSIINPDFDHADQLTLVNGMPSESDRNKGGKIGTLTVTISAPSGWTNAPTDAKLLDASGNEIENTSTTRIITLNRTDKDEARFNFNYDKVQLPYYNDYGTKNYTSNKVVTGWKITAITEVAGDPYTDANYDYSKTYADNQEYFDYPNYNFADRKSSKKDLYSVSKRVFSQGAYFDVPYGVTSITIEPYWGQAAYIADAKYDVVYKNDYSGKQGVTQVGAQITTFNSQTVHNSMTDALNALTLGSTVYDKAVVLVGNFHLDGVPSDGTKPFTMMSIDEDKDHEPDYCLIYHHKERKNICPIRFDFLAVPGTAQAQKPNDASLLCNFTIFKTRGWFEVTNTAFMYSNQLEYENGALGDNVTKIDAPLILLGGIFDQFVSTQSSTVNGHTIYLHLGGNLWIDQFGMGTHSDGKQSTPHVPVSVTGGDYVGFYLTGTYNKDAFVKDDNAECYISGGRFAELAGACQEQIGANTTTKGNVRWQIYNADITDFFGGGINDAKPVKGNITTDIFNSHVDVFCGGPKFGDMASGKSVTTTAEGCTFRNFFGAGYGGNSFSRKKYYDKDGTTQNWTTLQGYYTGDRGKYYDGNTTPSSQISGKDYGKKGPGVATDFDYEFFVWSSGKPGARFFVHFVSFSLAQCNDVSSTLKGCIINENFYGGGSLGKVKGNVTSELNGCTVKGNVFGAGYSAILPTIPVRDAGFEQQGTTYAFPSFNSSSGMFELGTYSGTTDYTWQHKDSYPNDNTPGFLTEGGDYDIQNGTSVVTTVDITSSNLGSVEGNVTLTIKGSSVIGTEGDDNTGNVYGGGDQSVVKQSIVNGNPVSNTGNTTVILQEGAHVLGNVYGGGNNGSVGGDSQVKIQDE